MIKTVTNFVTVFFIYNIIKNYIYKMNIKAIDYLNILELFIQSKYFPSDLVNDVKDYILDEDDSIHSVMLYVPTNEEVYSNFSKYEPTFKTSFENFLKNTEDLIKFNIDNFNITTLSNEESIVFEIIDQSMVFENVEVVQLTKLQKPDIESFDEVIGITGNCSECGQEDVNIDQHVCTTLVSTDIKEMVTTISDFKRILENKITEAFVSSVDELVEDQKYKIDSGLGGLFDLIYKGKENDMYKFYHPKTSHGFGDKFYTYTEDEVLNKIKK